MKASFQMLVVAIAVFGLGIGAAFGLGSAYGRRSSPAATPTAAAATGGTGGQQAGGAAAGASAGGAGGGAPTTGVIESIEGDTATIRTAAGGTVAVKLTPETRVQQIAGATAGDLRSGMNISVTGQPDVDGKVAARSIQIGGTGGPQGAGAAQGAGGAPGAGGQQASGRAAGTPVPTQAP
jgi:hypothetical protein